MVHNNSGLRKAFLCMNYSLTILFALLCILPFIFTLALSFSSNIAISRGVVSLWPVDFTTNAYKFVVQKKEFLTSILVSIQRVILGVTINMIITMLAAYPLSMDRQKFRSRDRYVWYFVITMLFGGGLIPHYMIVNSVGLIDTIWALVIPGAVPVYNVILMMNFIRQTPKELQESAFIDGAGYVRTLISIILPLCLPVIATLTLFTFVGHWNSWFDGLIFMNKPSNYPLQSYLQTVVVNVSNFTLITERELQTLRTINDRNIKAAQIFLSMLPIICIYPLLQRYFISGIVIGSVKG